LAKATFGATNTFPDTIFGVARGFPAVGPDNDIDINRIFYANHGGALVTHDLTPIPLGVLPKGPGTSKWQVQTLADWGVPQGTVLAESTITIKENKNLSQVLEALEKSSWEIGGVVAPDARLGLRLGQKLRNELLDFAGERGIQIGEIYMIDGSHADRRANAFAAGFGNGRIIGLYDTLFLGDTFKADGNTASGLYSIRKTSNTVRGMAYERMRGIERAPLQPGSKGKDMASMTDDEILAILGHELGHLALHHSETSMVTDTAAQFSTFALLGYLIASPTFAVSMGLAAPVAHIGLFVYNHVAGPTLDGIFTIFSNWLSRVFEYEADAYAARVSERYATALQTALSKLTVNCNEDPREPWYYEALWDDHPTTMKRYRNVESVKKRLYHKDADADVAEDQTAEDPKETAKPVKGDTPTPRAGELNEHTGELNEHRSGLDVKRSARN